MKKRSQKVEIINEMVRTGKGKDSKTFETIADAERFTNGLHHYFSMHDIKGIIVFRQRNVAYIEDYRKEKKIL